MSASARPQGRRAAAVAAAVVAAVLGPATAHAEDTSVVLGSRHKSFESPQHFAFELRFAPYTPAIDSDPGLHETAASWNDKHPGQALPNPAPRGTPYADTFGSKPRLEVAAEFDWQIVRVPHAGTLGVGASIGYTSMSADAVSLQDRKTPSDTTTLDIFPAYAIAVFRADAVWRDLRIPLVPYVKAGLGYGLWRASTTAGTVSVDNVAGKGQTFGYHVAGGVAFALDVLDPTSAKSLDNAIGINHTYLFAEWMYSALNGIGQSDALRIGTSTWAAGLAFEF